jgi:adenylyltransferase/sulfurtransferase
MLYPGIGEKGQKRLQHAQVAIIGCGALGGVMANTLVRSGVGYVRIVDRDFIELDNLQRQVLFDEHDIADGLPKAEAAARRLRRVNSAVEVEARVEDVSHKNIESLCHDADLILDGTDNFETRFLINDLAVKLGLPWVYGACVAAEGLVLPIIPRQTPCLRCIWDDAPPPGSTPTCDTAGVLSPLVNIVASLQALEAMKILIGDLDALNRKMVSIDVWTGQFRGLDMQPAYDKGHCVCCKQGKYEFLSGQRSSATATLCGRNAVQVSPPEGGGGKANFKQIAKRLPFDARPKVNDYMLRFTIDEYAVTLFPDGRAIIKGTADPAIARGVYAKYVGS